jgi:Type II secretion system (T2SS), protein E, N-terminal domain
MRLGQYLVAKGLLYPEDLELVLGKQRGLPRKRPLRRLGSLLIEVGLLSQGHVTQSLSELRGVRPAPETVMQVQADLFSIFPWEEMNRLGVAPLQINGQDVWVAMLDPHDERKVAEVQGLTAWRVVPFLATQYQVYKLMQSLPAAATEEPHPGSQPSGRSVRGSQRTVPPSGASTPSKASVPSRASTTPSKNSTPSRASARSNGPRRRGRPPEPSLPAGDPDTDCLVFWVPVPEGEKDKDK